jgi:hypothetical protein
MISTLLPARMSDRRWPFTTHDSGSARAICSLGRSTEALNALPRATTSAGSSMYSAMPPSIS